MSWETYRQRRRRDGRKRVALLGTIGFMVLLIGHYSCTVQPKQPERLSELEGEPVVRVKLTRVSGKQTARLTVRSPYSVYARPAGEPRGKLLARGTGLQEARVLLVGDEIQIGSTTLPASRVEVAPEQDGALHVGKRDYRGSLLIGAAGGKLLLVNRVKMEQYLAGVVGCEMPLSWNEAALTAQAIAARTYALYELTHQRRSDQFDVFDSTASQVYEGRTAESEVARRVVSRSRGMVMTWKDRPFKAFFHSTCGGQTVGARKVFPEHDITPLSGRACTHCSSSKVYRWSRAFDRKTLSTRLSRALKRPIRLQAIEVTDRADGRVITVRLLHDGKQTLVSGTRLRMAIGPGRDGLLSTSFDVVVQGDKLVFSGRGWGHGVGMCQFGAKGLGEQGKPAGDIVRFFYPGAELIKLW